MTFILAAGSSVVCVCEQEAEQVNSKGALNHAQSSHDTPTHSGMLPLLRKAWCGGGTATCRSPTKKYSLVLFVASFVCFLVFFSFHITAQVDRVVTTVGVAPVAVAACPFIPELQLQPNCADPAP